MGDFLIQGSDGGETFCLLFRNLHKIWIEESMDLNFNEFSRVGGQTLITLACRGT